MNFREKIERRREISDNATSANINEPGESFDNDYFGIENIRNSPACLDLRFTDGNRKALPYSYIIEINFNPSEGIEILTATKHVKIEGRELNRLFDYLTAYRVKYIQVQIGTDTDEKGLVIKNITVQPLP